MARQTGNSLHIQENEYDSLYTAPEESSAWDRGVDSMQASLYGFASAVGGFTGVDVLEEWGEEGVERNMREIAQNPPEIHSWDDVESLSDFGTYWAETMAEQAPQLLMDAAVALGLTAATVLTGGAAAPAAVGAIGARAAAKETIKQFTKRHMAQLGKKASRMPGMKQGYAQFNAMKGKVPAGALAKTTQAGKWLKDKTGTVSPAVAGLALSNIAQNVGETQNNFQLRDIDQPGAALLAGTFKAALDTLAPVRLLGLSKKLGTAPENVPQLMARMGRELGITAASEGATESVQTIVDHAAVNAFDPDFDMFDKAAWSEIVTAGTKGALVGGSIGGAVAGTLESRAYLRRKAEVDEQLTQDIAAAMDLVERQEQADREDVALAARTDQNIANPPETPIVPEDQETIDAQAEAIADPTSTKDTMEVTGGSPQPTDGILPDGTIILPSDNGTVYTTNQEKADLLANTQKARGKENDDDEEAIGQALYNAPGGKRGSNGEVIVATNARGQPIFEKLTSPEARDADLAEAQRQAPAGGEVFATTADQVIQARTTRRGDQMVLDRGGETMERFAFDEQAQAPRRSEEVADQQTREREESAMDAALNEVFRDPKTREGARQVLMGERSVSPEIEQQLIQAVGPSFNRILNTDEDAYGQQRPEFVPEQTTESVDEQDPTEQSAEESQRVSEYGDQVRIEDQDRAGQVRAALNPSRPVRRQDKRPNRFKDYRDADTFAGQLSEGQEGRYQVRRRMREDGRPDQGFEVVEVQGHRTREAAEEALRAATITADGDPIQVGTYRELRDAKESLSVTEPDRVYTIQRNPDDRKQFQLKEQVRLPADPSVGEMRVTERGGRFFVEEDLLPEPMASSNLAKMDPEIGQYGAPTGRRMPVGAMVDEFIRANPEKVSAARMKLRNRPWQTAETRAEIDDTMVLLENRETGERERFLAPDILTLGNAILSSEKTSTEMEGDRRRFTAFNTGMAALRERGWASTPETVRNPIVAGNRSWKREGPAGSAVRLNALRGREAEERAKGQDSAQRPKGPDDRGSTDPVGDQVTLDQAQRQLAPASQELAKTEDAIRGLESQLENDELTRPAREDAEQTLRRLRRRRNGQSRRLNNLIQTLAAFGDEAGDTMRRNLIRDTNTTLANTESRIVDAVNQERRARTDRERQRAARLLDRLEQQRASQTALLNRLEDPQFDSFQNTDDRLGQREDRQGEGETDSRQEQGFLYENDARYRSDGTTPIANALRETPSARRDQPLPRERVEAQTAAFIAGGGQVNEVPAGLVDASGKKLGRTIGFGDLGDRDDARGLLQFVDGILKHVGLDKLGMVVANANALDDVVQAGHLTEEEVGAVREKLADPQRAAVFVPRGRQGVIILKPIKNRDLRLATAGHEVGHAVFNALEKVIRDPQTTRERALVERLTAAFARDRDGDDTYAPADYKEWFADKVAAQAIGIARARDRGLAERYFKSSAETLRKVFNRVKGSVHPRLHKRLKRNIKFENVVRDYRKDGVFQRMQNVGYGEIESLTLPPPLTAREEGIPRRRFNMGIDMLRQLGGKTRKKGVEVAKKALDADNRIRLLGFPEIADLIYKTTNTVLAKLPYWSAVRDAQAEFFGRINDVLSMRNENQGLRAAIFWELAEEKPTAELSARAKALRKVIEDFHQYLLDAGLPVGKLENYFPRQYDINRILAKADQFMEILTRNGFTTAQALDMYERMTAPRQYHAMEDFAPKRLPIQFEREIPVGVARELAEAGFLNPDPGRALMSYINKYTREAEHRRMFGGYHYLDGSTRQFNLAKMGSMERQSAEAANREILVDYLLRNGIIDTRGYERATPEAKAGMVRSGFEEAQRLGYAQVDEEGDTLWLHPDARLNDLLDDAVATKTAEMEPAEAAAVERELRMLVDHALDRHDPLDPTSTMYNVIGEVRAYESLKLLLFSGVASVPEAAAAFARAKGELGLQEFSGMVWDQVRNGEELRETIHILGAAQHAMGESLMTELGSRFDGGGSKRFFRDMLPYMFKFNGNDAVVEYSRALAARVGMEFLVNSAAKANEGSYPHQRYLAELNIDAGTVMRWKAQRDRYGLNASLKDRSDSQAGDDARMMRRALNLFIDESVLRPNAAERPTWADHPVGTFVFHLKTFGYVFSKRVVGGIGRATAQKMRDNPDDPANALREALVYTAPMLMVFMAFGALSDELRNRIKTLGDDGTWGASYEDPKRMLMNWADRTGLFTSMPFFDPIWDMATFNPSLNGLAFGAGPTASHLYDLFGDGEGISGNEVVRSVPGVSQIAPLRQAGYAALR